MLLHQFSDLLHRSVLSTKLLQSEDNVLWAELAVGVGVEAVEHSLQTLDSAFPVEELLGVDGGRQKLVVVDAVVRVVVHFLNDCFQLGRVHLVMLVLFDGRVELTFLDHAVSVLVNCLELQLQVVDALLRHRLHDHVHRSLPEKGLALERFKPLESFLH